MKTVPPSLVLVRSLALLLLALLVAPRAGLAAAPNPPGQISYQGFLVDANGAALAASAPRNYDVIFSIYDSPLAGTLVWQELQTVTVDRGYFSVMLGQGSAVTASVFTNDLTGVFASPTASDRYIGLTVKGLGGPDVEIQPRLRLIASPYSLLAANANALVDGNGKAVIRASGGNIIVSNNISAPSFVGNPSFPGNPVFAGTPTFSGSPIFGASLGIGTAAAYPLDMVAGQAVARLSTTNSSSGSVLELKNKRLTTSGSAQTLGAINFTTGNNSSDVTYRGQISYYDNYDGSGSVRVSAGTANNNALYVHSSGNVGIGWPTPSYRLQVVGTSSFLGAMLVTGNVTMNNGDLSVNGDISATGIITQGSDQTKKTDFAPVDTDAVLEAVGKLPIQRWRFKDEQQSLRHMGPMAQDFRAAFGLGENETTIATVDSEGVALAAIQGLKQRTEAQAAELRARDAEIQQLKQGLAELREALARLAPPAK